MFGWRKARNSSNENEQPKQNPANSPKKVFEDYLERASVARESGDGILALHLYLSAFEESLQESEKPEQAAIDGLREAWDCAYEQKERALAEYVFDKLEPYLSPDETAEFIDRLQALALDKLEEFGLSREDLDSMARSIASEIPGMENARMVKVETFPNMTFPYGKRSETVPRATGGSKTAGTDKKGGEIEIAHRAPRPTFNDLVGYDSVLKSMRAIGIGMEKDPQYVELLNTLNIQHGLHHAPPTDTLLIRSTSRADAVCLMSALAGELDLPDIHMRIDENFSGMPVLSITALADERLKLNQSKTAIQGKAILILEDIDLWGLPVVDSAEDSFGAFVMAQMTRGARDAIALIDSSVENPDILVVCSMGYDTDIDPFFWDLLAPFTEILMDTPDAGERSKIWIDIAKHHPSLRMIDRSTLVRCSEGLSRYDMYTAAREAVEDSYREAVEERKYRPVPSSLLYEKVASFQPLDSPEYKELEDLIARSFTRSLGEVEEFLHEQD